MGIKIVFCCCFFLCCFFYNSTRMFFFEYITVSRLSRSYPPFDFAVKILMVSQFGDL